MAAQASAGTFDALRQRDFKRYFIGQLASTSGTWMQLTAQGWLVFQITHSAAWLGIVTCAAGLPILLLSPVAGVIVERFPRRQTMIVTQTIQMVLAFILAALVMLNAVQIWEIVVLALLLGITNAVDGTARLAIIADLVDREDLRSAITLNSILFNASRVLGPASAGLALVAVGAGWCFFLNGLSFIPVIISLMIIHVRPVRHIAAEPPLRQLAEGIQYARGHQQILPSLLLAAIGGLIGVSMLTLFPAFASVVLNSPTSGYTVISVANGLGGILAGFALGWMARRAGLGRLIALVALLSALSIGLLAGSVTILTATLVAFGFGVVIVTLFVAVTTLIQVEVPDAFRGRVLALYNLAFSGLTPFGSLLLGLISANIGVLNTFLLSGGLFGLLSVVVLLRWPGLWQRQTISARPVFAGANQPCPEG